jgi:hypothetical protein
VTSGLLYPVRIETGSILLKSSSTNGRVGVDITKRIGIDGTFYGETGYNILTDIDLWPWPNENAIRKTMQGYSPGVLSGSRGFCAAAKQKNGVDDITLTSYIWEYLGNKMPSDIYANSKSLSVPGTPLKLSVGQ